SGRIVRRWSPTGAAAWERAWERAWNLTLRRTRRSFHARGRTSTEAEVLELSLIGEIAVRRDAQEVSLPGSAKTRALLAYLAATGREHRRESLCSLFWNVPDDPKGALRWSLSKLRQAVDEPDRARLLADRETVRLDL